MFLGMFLLSLPTIFKHGSLPTLAPPQGQILWQARVWSQMSHGIRADLWVECPSIQWCSHTVQTMSRPNRPTPSLKSPIVDAAGFVEHRPHSNTPPLEIFASSSPSEDSGAMWNFLMPPYQANHQTYISPGIGWFLSSEQNHSVGASVI